MLDRLAADQARRPGWWGAVAVLVTLLAAPAALGIGIDGDLTSLLPDDAPSVRDLDRARTRFGAPQTLTLLVWSSDHPASQRFVDALAPRLSALREPGVIGVDASMRAYADLAEAHRHLFVPTTELAELLRVVRAEAARAETSSHPLYIDLEGPPPELAAWLDRLEAAQRTAARSAFFAHPDHQSLAVFLRTDIQGGDAARVDALLAAVGRVVEEAAPGSYAPDLRVEYGGSLLDVAEEQRALANAAAGATALTILLVALVVVLYFRMLRSIPILALGLVPPIALTFALARGLVDDLNASSAFLVAVVIGNGVNPHIVWLARYVEVRRAGASIERALLESHRSTFLATLTASLAAAAAYASLAPTDFRGFRDFGAIGAIGMITCWLATFSVTPCLAAAFDRFRPIAKLAEAQRVDPFGRALVFVALSRPKLVLWAAAVATCVGVALVTVWASGDPFEYDFRNLISAREDTPLQRLASRVAATVDETTSGAALGIVLASPESARGARAHLSAYTATHEGCCGAVRSIEDLLPPEQARAVELLTEIRAALDPLLPHLGSELRGRIESVAPPDELTLLTAADLPDTAARPFTELDGTRGSILYLEHDATRDIFDGRYLREWTAAARSVRDPDGTPAAVIGWAPVIADLVDAIARSAPRAVLASFVATVLLVVLAFQRRRDAALVLGSHLAGVLWMVAALSALGMRINFLNFLALPITFGNGVDYGVNVMRRHAIERDASNDDRAIRDTVRGVGGAVLLCSLTTVIGYVALWTSPNRAVQSLGTAMTVSELVCVLAALVVLPAALQVLRRSGRTRGRKEPEQAAADGKPERA